MGSGKLCRANLTKLNISVKKITKFVLLKILKKKTLDGFETQMQEV